MKNANLRIFPKVAHEQNTTPEYPDRNEQRSAEDIFVERAKLHGWKLLRHGWPDYLLVKPRGARFEFIAVEVKQDHVSDKLREGQRLMLAALVLQGLSCFVWSAEDYTLRRIKTPEATKTLKRYFRMLESLNSNG